MEDHQEFEKPIFEFRHNKSRRSSRVSRNREMNHYEEISNPKKTQKSPLDHRLGTRRKKNEKSLIRCEECGKGFRYEKCLLNHRELIHPEESMRRGRRRRSPLFSFFEYVQRRKRSKRVSRYKKITPFSVSSVDDVDLLEVAESLILLSKSDGNFLNGLKLVGDDALEMNLRKAREFRDGFLRNEQKELVSEALSDEFEDGFLSDKQKKLVGVSSETVGTWKEFTETGIDQKLGCQETAFEDSGNRGFEMNNEHRCRLCDKVFSSYQALGGHQTFHRATTKLKSQTKRCKEESVEAEAETNDSVALTHECRVCSRVFRSIHALRGHKKCHNMRTFDGETFGFDLHVSMVNW